MEIFPDRIEIESPGLRIAPSIAAALPKGAIDLLDFLRRARQPPGTGQFVELSGLSRPTVTKQLGALRDQGLVVWEGKFDKDPRAVWRLPDAYR